MRIIGGQWKRTRLKVVSKPGLRPTPDRVRETLFNWLGQGLLAGAAWTLRARVCWVSAASRGAASVLMLEHMTPALVAQRGRTTAAAGSRRRAGAAR